MNKQQKYNQLYMDIAERVSKMSHACRLHVGAIIVKDGRIISMGWNGMPAGWDNNCEYKDYDLSKDFNGNHFPDPYNHYPFIDDTGRYGLKTRPEVLHAETNALAKLAKSTESGNNATMFITHSPCLDCAKLIFQSGISNVFYRDSYRSETGIQFLEKSGIEVKKINLEES